MIVDCAHYRDGRRQHDGPMELEQAADFCHGNDEGFVWLGLFEPSIEELTEVQDRFGLHDLAIEDVQNMHLRPKVEQYDEVSFIVLRTARYLDDVEEVDFGEVGVFIGQRFAIAVRQGAASDLRDSRARLERRPDLLAHGPLAALWAIMDKIVDDYSPAVIGLEHDIEELEEVIFTGSVASSERIYSLRREATELYRAMHPLIVPLDAIARGSLLPVAKKLRPFFRDISDHLKLAQEDVAQQRDQLAVMMQANLAVISVEQNDISVRQSEISKQLTLVATVFLPLTFLTGFFGMNFGWLTDQISSLWEFLVLGLGSFIASLVVLWLFFRRRGYFGAER